MRIAITGVSGFVGRALVASFAARGDDVTRVVRSYGAIPPDERTVIWQPTQGSIERAGLEAQDVVIHLAGESLAGVWTRAKKQRIRDSRELGTALLARTLAGLRQPPRVLISASGMNFYGSRAEAVDETAAAGTGFLADVVKLWEGATLPARNAGIRVLHMRFGNVLHPDGGLLALLVPLCRLGLGAPFGNGRQPWPWIARAEIAPAILHLLEHTAISGPVNIVAPDAETNQEFKGALAAAAGRRSYLRVPSFAARLAPGGMADELLLGGAPVVPRVLLESGYRFQWPSLRPALDAML
ncbi:MAG: TIGR01777 family protein [Gemmatimonadetes bacterium]|nr:TIGR01777 family protein [Gemmatimonadota bacterium]